jgi:hypothetical protein
LWEVNKKIGFWVLGVGYRGKGKRTEGRRERREDRREKSKIGKTENGGQ